jgi:hypothetical protein
MLRATSLAALINHGHGHASSSHATPSARVTITLLEHDPAGEERHVLIKRVLRSSASTTQIKICPGADWKTVRPVRQCCCEQFHTTSSPWAAFPALLTA